MKRSTWSVCVALSVALAGAAHSAGVVVKQRATVHGSVCDRHNHDNLWCGCINDSNIHGIRIRELTVGYGQCHRCQAHWKYYHGIDTTGRTANPCPFVGQGVTVRI